MARGAANALSVVVVLAVAGDAAAQPPPSGPAEGLDFGRPSERVLPTPEFREPTPVLPDLRPVEPSAPAPGVPTEGTEPTVVLRDIRFRGNTQFDDAALGAVAAPWIGRPLTTEDLDALRIAVTRHYVDGGYINSGAVIPDQQVGKGVLILEIVEGRLSEILISGNTGLRADYLRERIALGGGPPLNVNALQEQLQIQAQNPLLARLNADLRPGDRPGDARLAVEVAEPRPYRLVLQVDNDLSPDLGPVQGKAVGVLYNPTGWGDVLTGQVTFGRGLNEFAARYSRPVSARDTLLEVYGERKNSRIVEAPLDQLDIKGNSSTLGVSLSHPVYRTPRAQLLLGVAFEQRHSQTFLLSRPFAFSPGVEPNGESTVSVIRLSQDWVQRTREQVFAARSTFSIGLDAFGATINNDGQPDGSFISWLGQVQWARRFGDNYNELILRADGQLTDDPLLPLEQFSIGGINSVRGYRTNLLVRDWGYTASVEVRIPVLRDEGGRTTLRLAPFFDIGGGWQRERPTIYPRTISSLGAGILWDPAPGVQGVVYLGIPLRKLDFANDSIQDVGVHFALTASLFD